MDLYFKTALVFAHFALAAFCLVTILATDLKLLKHYRTPASAALCAEIEHIKHAVSYGLAGLWSTGIVIVGYGIASGPAYLDNEKLWFKIFVVAVLTLNGVLVHRMGKALRPGVTLARLDDRTALKLNLAGATSSISWLWACLLGTARAWNGTLSFKTIMLYYVLSLTAGLSLAAGLHLHHRRALPGLPADEEANAVAGEWPVDEVVAAPEGAVARDAALH